MKGCFGGLLGLANLLGGLILSLLVGGISWQKSWEARFYRVLCGSLLLGVTIGTGVFLATLQAAQAIPVEEILTDLSTQDHQSQLAAESRQRQKRENRAVMYGLCAGVTSAAGLMGLELLRQKLEDED